jgi:hypothetical protein
MSSDLVMQALVGGAPVVTLLCRKPPHETCSGCGVLHIEGGPDEPDRLRVPRYSGCYSDLLPSCSRSSAPSLVVPLEASEEARL